MKPVLVTLLMILILFEIVFIAYDILRRRFTKRMKDYHQEAFFRIGCPPANWSAFTVSLNEQNALTVQAKYIHSAGYRKLNDKETAFLGDQLRRLFFVQLILGFCFISILIFLFSG
jgi:hypothetical protein